MGREEGSGWGTHVYLWQIHFDIWQNQYNIVKLNKIKLKKKKEVGTGVQRVSLSPLQELAPPAASPFQSCAPGSRAPGSPAPRPRKPRPDEGGFPERTARGNQKETRGGAVQGALAFFLSMTTTN